MAVYLNGPSVDNSLQIVPILQGYLQEAKAARSGGLNPRDLKWEENLHLYWNRYDHSQKAAWQATETLPEVSSFVDRFAAALKEALVASPTGFYSIDDPADQEGDVADAVKRMTDVWLSMCGRNQTGTCLSFGAVFEEQVKLGALTAMSSVVGWDASYKQGRVKVETVDPRMVYLDPTYRNLYRVRRVELDKHELRDMAGQKDKKGRQIFNRAAIEQMVSHIEGEDQTRREQLSGHGQQMVSTRQPITMDEYIGTVVSTTGEVLAKDALMVVGNGQFLIRGPEANPYWHGKDWLTFCPLVTTPLSVYGRSYMEDFGSIAQTFNKLTNLILDAVQMSTMKAFACVPSMLANPEQLSSGITPNKLFLLEEGVPVADFMKAIDLGHMGPESLQVWQAIKGELSEAADINEIGLGQFAPKGRTSATEISQTQESSSALIRSVAQTIETRWLSPTLDLVWQTGIQHLSASDKQLAAACGEDLFPVLMKRKRELANRPYTFQAHGISATIQKGRTLKALLQLMAFMSQSPELLAEFMKVVDLNKFMKLLFRLSDIDITRLTMTEREKMIQQTTQAFQQAAQNQQAAPGGNAPPGAASPPGGLPAGAGAQQMQQLLSGAGLARAG